MWIWSPGLILHSLVKFTKYLSPLIQIKPLLCLCYLLFLFVWMTHITAISTLSVLVDDSHHCNIYCFCFCGWLTWLQYLLFLFLVEDTHERPIHSNRSLLCLCYLLFLFLLMTHMTAISLACFSGSLSKAHPFKALPDWPITFWKLSEN